MTSPSGETKEPEPPLLKRTEDFCTCSYHSGPGSKPYFSLRSFLGGLLNSHMPSPATRSETGTIIVRPSNPKRRKNRRMDVYSVNMIENIGSEPHSRGGAFTSLLNSASAPCARRPRAELR